MAPKTTNQITVQCDDESYLVNPDDWTPQLADALAHEDGLVLTDEHWVAINFMREYYTDRGITPDIRHVAKHLAAHLNCDKKAAKAHCCPIKRKGKAPNSAVVVTMDL